MKNNFINNYIKEKERKRKEIKKGKELFKYFL